MWSPTISSEYLMHHGILGQKWGVRRYQNKDGTRTSAGKKRLSEEQKSKIKKAAINEGLILGTSAVSTIAMRQMTGQSMDPKSVARQIIATYAMASISGKTRQAIKNRSAKAMHKFFSPSNISNGKKALDGLNMENMTMQDLKDLDLY